LAEDGQNFPEYHAFLKDFFLTHSIQVPFDRKMPRQTSTAEAAKVRGEHFQEDVQMGKGRRALPRGRTDGEREESSSKRTYRWGKGGELFQENVRMGKGRRALPRERTDGEREESSSKRTYRWGKWRGALPTGNMNVLYCI